jgi:hypothetical protein
VIKSRRTRLAGHVTCMGETVNLHKILVEKPEGNVLFGRPKRRWEDNIRNDLRKTV